MQRPTVRVVPMRIEHIRIGDVVNRDLDASKGWFEVVEIRRLHDGSFAVVGADIKTTFSGTGQDVVAVQMLEETTFPAPAAAQETAPIPDSPPAPLPSRARPPEAESPSARPQDPVGARDGAGPGSWSPPPGSPSHAARPASPAPQRPTVDVAPAHTGWSPPPASTSDAGTPRPPTPQPA